MLRGVCEKENCVSNSPLGKRVKVVKNKRLVGESGGQIRSPPTVKTKTFGSNENLAVNMGELLLDHKSPFQHFSREGYKLLMTLGESKTSKWRGIKLKIGLWQFRN